MYWTDDPLMDFNRHERELEEKLKKLPICDYCDEYVQDDFYFEINGEIICECCLDRFFRKDVDDYVG